MLYVSIITINKSKRIIYPLLGPLTQLGTSIDTNYTNSWTLRRLIQDNAQYILAQLDRIRLSVTQLQQDLASHRDQVQILQQQILDLREQLAAAMAAGQSEETLRQQITALTTRESIKQFSLLYFDA